MENYPGLLLRLYDIPLGELCPALLHHFCFCNSAQCHQERVCAEVRYFLRFSFYLLDLLVSPAYRFGVFHLRKPRDFTAGDLKADLINTTMLRLRVDNVDQVGRWQSRTAVLRDGRPPDYPKAR